jgi:hypothetical protein
VCEENREEGEELQWQQLQQKCERDESLVEWM